MDFTAPAKINLYLRVIQKRDDGFHEIETLFERISLSDDLSIHKTAESSEIQCSHPDISTDENSLLGKTLKEFKEYSGSRENFRINLRKNIPISAGLGGGSSDAASLLKGLNELSGFPLSNEELMAIGGQLGSDVPFFIKDVSFAIGKGRGELIEPVKIRAKLGHLLVTPPWGVATKDIYSKVSDFGLTKGGGVDRMVSAFLDEEAETSFTEYFRNDLQTIVLREFPLLKKVFSELEALGAQGVLLSGSGSTVFGIFGEKELRKAEKMAKNIFPAEKKWFVSEAHTY